MSDQGFHFRPPPRREPRQFEPPPWEKDAFERFAEEDAKRQLAPDAPEAEEELAERAGEEPCFSQEPAASEPVAPEPASGARLAQAAGGVEEEAEVDERQVARMMLELRAEEPATLPNAWLVNGVSGGVVLLVGLVVAIWGLAALARQRTGGVVVLAAGVLLMFGIGFMGIGGWLVFKVLRQRGVL